MMTSAEISGAHYGITPQEERKSKRILRGNTHYRELMEKLANPNTPPEEVDAIHEEARQIHDKAWIHTTPKRERRIKPKTG